MQFVIKLTIFINVLISGYVQTAPTLGQTTNIRWTSYIHCPPNYFLTAIRPVFLIPSARLPATVGNNNQHAVYGFNVSCDSILVTESTIYYAEIPLLQDLSLNASDLRFRGQINYVREVPLDWEPENYLLYGMAVGIEKRVQIDHHQRNLLEIGFYINDREAVSRKQEFVQTAHLPGLWTSPNFCPWGQYICGFKIKYDSETFLVHDVKTVCCTLFQETLGWTNYRGGTAGHVIESMSNHQELGDLRPMSLFHYAKELDDPYYYGWKFCPEQSYVTGLQGQQFHRQFQLSCSDIRKPYPREKKFLQTSPDNSIWEWEDQLTKHVECEGVVIGFQVLYDQVGQPIQGLRLFCSYNTKRTDELTYVKVLFPKSHSSGTSEYLWGKPQMCKRNQAVCGFKTKDAKDSQANSVGTEHIKAKCCVVPSVAEVCAPYDRFELVVECDARLARAETTCQYTFSEGMTIADTLTKSVRENQDLRNSLSREWSQSEADLERHTVETGESATRGESISTTRLLSNGTSTNAGITNTGSSGTSSSVGKTQAQNRGSTKGSVRGRSSMQGLDRAKSSEKSQTHSETSGTSSGGSLAHTYGQSQNNLKTKSQSNSFTDTTADTVGSSQGSVSALTEGSSHGSTSGHTSSQTHSSSSTAGNTKTMGTSSSNTAGLSGSVEAEGGVNVYVFSASVKARIETSFSATTGSTSEYSNHASSTSGNELSEGTSSQLSQENTKSAMNQNTHESSNSKTKSSARENGNTNTLARGSEINRGFTGTKTQETNQQKTGGRQAGVSNSHTERETHESNFQENSQATLETSDTENQVQGSETSRSLQMTRSRDDTSTISNTDAAEKTYSKTAHSSNSSGKELSSTRGQSTGKVQDRTFSTGFDWTQTSGHTWTKEKAYEVRMTVPAGLRSRLYQVVGYCDHFQMRTNNFKREDFGEPGMEIPEEEESPISLN